MTLHQLHFKICLVVLLNVLNALQYKEWKRLDINPCDKKALYKALVAPTHINIKSMYSNIQFTQNLSD